MMRDWAGILPHEKILGIMSLDHLFVHTIDFIGISNKFKSGLPQIVVIAFFGDRPGLALFAKCFIESDRRKPGGPYEPISHRRILVRLGGIIEHQRVAEDSDIMFQRSADRRE